MQQSCPSCFGLSRARRQYNTVRVVFPNQTIMTIAGRSGLVGQAGDGGAATAALFSSLVYAAPDGAGGMWLADYANLQLR